MAQALKFIPKARKIYNIKDENGILLHNPKSQDLSFKPAYIVTNEDLRKTTKINIKPNSEILTIAGSGDQALFYSKFSPKRLDLFDVSFCSYVITDIKFAAIQHLPTYADFFLLIDDIYNSLKPTNENESLMKILPYTHKITQTFIKKMHNCNLFYQEYWPLEYFSNYLINASEFEEIKAKIKPKFNFIWSDVANVHKHVMNKKYDIINLSNIFEWDSNYALHIITKLQKHLKPDGCILLQTSRTISKQHQNLYKDAQKKFKKNGTIQKLNISNHKVVLFTKTR